MTTAHSGVLGRAAAASVALVLAVATATGLFVAKIARSYATPADPGLTDSGDRTGYGGSGQLSPQQLDQPPAGRSHGS